jgi:protein O-GlcNAc transferase
LAAFISNRLSLAPNQPSSHVTLAAVLSEQGDRPAAAAERKIAADLSRAAVSHQRAQFALDSGRALLKQGKVQDALTQLQTAVEAEPTLAAAHLALAEALQRAGQTVPASLERDRAAALASPHTP